MKIVDVICSEGRTGFYFDDQRAIKKGVEIDGFRYIGEAETEGFNEIRQAGESISVMLVLEDGQIGTGDCAAVQYSGAGGRDVLFLAKEFMPFIETTIRMMLIGQDAKAFRVLSEMIDTMDYNDKPLHTAIRYGVTQALLDAAAKSEKMTIAEKIIKDYNLTTKLASVPIFTQSGDDRYNNVDKMIIKGADVLPHALINNVDLKLGKEGEILKEYIIWLRNRILKTNKSVDYKPVLHIDVYGTIGILFNNDVSDMADYLQVLEEEAYPFTLRIEGPMDVEDRTLQIQSLGELKQILDDRGSKLELVADEWCNTFEDIKLFVDHNAADMVQIKTPDLGGVNNIIEAIIYCKDSGVGAYCGGTCNETDRSAQICTQIAMACAADQCLAKPGMGVDEGYMIVFNEMNRVLALAKGRQL